MISNDTSTYQCEHCKKFFSKYGIKSHIWKVHTSIGKSHAPMKGRKAWNSGKKLPPLSEDTKRKLSISISKLGGRPHSEISKKKISEAMKKAHSENRAYNIGYNKHRYQPSWPEQFFTKAIENEFDDKNYIPEHPAGKYRIDFAWVNKKRAIEIDGSQHERKEHLDRDIQKDMFLRTKGWSILRIKWVDMYHEPQKYISIAKDFINAPVDS